jgi:hypothetical protein
VGISGSAMFILILAYFMLFHDECGAAGEAAYLTDLREMPAFE